MKRGTLVLLGVMLLFVGGYLLLVQKDAVDFLSTPPAPTPTPIPALLSFDPGLVRAIELVTPPAEEIRLQRTADGSWTVNTAAGSAAPGTAEQVLDELLAIRPTALLATAPEESATGLGVGATRLRLALSDGSTLEVRIGQQNPMGSGYYARAGDGPTALVRTGGIETVLQLLREAAFPPTPTPSASGVP